MSNPQQQFPQQRPSSRPEPTGMSPAMRGVMWVAIFALIAAAIICVIWVLFTPENDVIGKAFLTIVLLAAFAGVALLDAHLAPGRPEWVVTASMASWVIALLCGLTLLWTPTNYWYTGTFKTWNFLVIVVFLQLALLHQRLLWRAHARYVTSFTRILAVATTFFVLALLAMALVPLTLPDLFEYPDLYGRIMVALAILGAVGSALVPLVNGLFGPRKQPASQPAQTGLLPWPTYADGVTPIPMLPNGQPDFEAQRTGVASPGSREFGPAPQAFPQQPYPQQVTQPYPQAQFPEPAPPQRPEPPQPPAS